MNGIRAWNIKCIMEMLETFINSKKSFPSLAHYVIGQSIIEYENRFSLTR